LVITEVEEQVFADDPYYSMGEGGFDLIASIGRKREEKLASLDPGWAIDLERVTAERRLQLRHLLNDDTWGSS